VAYRSISAERRSPLGVIGAMRNRWEIMELDDGGKDIA
jgi:hypothetical protein